jgi:hypothetical protein
MAQFLLSGLKFHGKYMNYIVFNIQVRSGYPYAPRPYTGPLCTALSFLSQLQRRSTPFKRESPLLAKEEIGREMADLILPVTQLPCNQRVL